MRYQGLVGWFKGSLLRVARFGDFVGEYSSVPAEGWYVSAFQGNLYDDGFGSLFCGNLECGKEYCVTII